MIAANKPDDGYVALLGGTGFIGEAIGRCLEGRGIGFRPFSRSTHPSYDITHPVCEEIIGGASAIVFMAHSRETDALDTRLHGRALEDLCVALRGRFRDVPIVVVSSMAATSGNPSLYAASKRELETVARANGCSVVRPGFVWSEASRGIAGSLRRAARLPIIPLPDGGRQILYTVHVDDCAAVVVNCLLSGGPAITLTVAHSEPVELRELIRRLGALDGRRNLIHLPVSAKRVLTCLRLLGVLRIPTPVASDALVSLGASQALRRGPGGDSPTGVCLRPLPRR